MMKELLNKLHQAKTPLEKDELKKELIRAIVSCTSYEDAKEFVELLMKILYEHSYYKNHYKKVVVSLREVFEEIL